jgi:hypothetical protein
VTGVREAIGAQRKAQAAAQALRLGKDCNAAMRGEGKCTRQITCDATPSYPGRSHCWTATTSCLPRMIRPLFRLTL